MTTDADLARTKAQREHPNAVTAFLHGVNLAVPIGAAGTYADFPEGPEQDAAVMAGREFALWIKTARR